MNDELTQGLTTAFAALSEEMAVHLAATVGATVAQATNGLGKPTYMLWAYAAAPDSLKAMVPNSVEITETCWLCLAPKFGVGDEPIAGEVVWTDVLVSGDRLLLIR